jgi:hypothetical protein
MHCAHADARCLDLGVTCTACDDRGYPTTARRRLKRCGTALLEDVDDGQRFKVKKTRTGDRLVPVWAERVFWSGAQGFAAFALLLACLGAEGEYLPWDDGKPMDEDAWTKRRFTNTSKVPVWHRTCNEVVTRANIACLCNGAAIMCSCNTTGDGNWRRGCNGKERPGKWCNRREEIVALGPERGFEVVTDADTWQRECTGIKWCPLLRCLTCKELVDTTTVNSQTQGTHAGCSCHSHHARHWRDRREEVVAFGRERGFEVLTSEEDWLRECDGNQWHPTLRCTTCDDVVTSTALLPLLRGGNAGCSCNVGITWQDHRPQVVAWGDERGFKVLTTPDEWQACTGKGWCPTLQCLTCSDIVTTTSVGTLLRNALGCSCHKASLHHWRNRRDEVVAWGEERSFEVVTDAETWLRECHGAHWHPTLRCLRCNELVTGVKINTIQQGGFGCKSCRFKTEYRLHKWLLQTYPQPVCVTQQYLGPNTTTRRTRFDFHLTFPDGFEVIVELDGAQHFWPHVRFFTMEGCERDLAKEEWATARGMCVVRVLQQDVWDNRRKWGSFLKESIDAARTGAPRVLTPAVPEYTSNQSAYVQLRAPK